MQATYLVEPHKTAASVLTSKEFSIELWANALRAGTLQDQDTFIAYCDLATCGAANDWDGKRGAALSLHREITTEVLTPACALYRSWTAQQTSPSGE
jgi:hypothetical protein